MSNELSNELPEAPAGKSKRGGRLLAVAVVLAAGIGGGVWYLQSDDGATHPGREQPAFPGPSGMCPAAHEIMSRRGYQPATPEARHDTRVSCRFITSGLSLLEDGANSLNVDVAVWGDDAEGRYQRFLDTFTSRRDDRRQEQNYRLRKLEPFPVGDAGFIYHTEWINPGAEETSTTAFFRTGDQLTMIAVSGYVQHVSPTGVELPREPLTEEVTHRELTDIVSSLSGTGTPGKPRITPPALRENPLLTGLTAPELPAEGPACAAFGDVAGKTGTRLDEADSHQVAGATWYTCTFESPEPPQDPPDGYRQRLVKIRFVTYAPEEAFRATEQIGRDLPAVRSTAAAHHDTPPSPPYELPVGDIGYVFYTAPGWAEATAAYVLNGRTYVEIMVRGFTFVDGDSRPLPEDVALKDIAALLS